MIKPVLLIIGTRPEMLKMLPIIYSFRANGLPHEVCLTGQHVEMIEQILDLFKLEVDYKLVDLEKNQSLTTIASTLLISISRILSSKEFSMVVVHGDTSSAMYGAIAAFNENIPVAHIESGLRTFDMKSPFPEEFFRKSIDSISTLLFAPTILNYQNLIDEGIKKDNIIVTGNTVVDLQKITYKDNFDSELLRWAGDSKLIILTAHRRENIPTNLISIFKSIKFLLESRHDIKIIYPIHPNPSIREIYDGCGIQSKNIKVTDSLGIIEFHNLIARSYLIMTDSGGIQEEAPTYGVPVIVLRDTTERQEAINLGTAIKVGTNYEDIIDVTNRFLDDEKFYQGFIKNKNPFGDGNASEKILKVISDFIK